MEKIRKVYFIEVKSPSSHIFSFVEIFRLGSVLLATILKNLGFETKVFIEDIREIYSYENDEIIREELFDADMICISTITSTAIRAYQIAKKFRAQNIPVVIGGTHVTFLPEEGLRYADFVVRGEGEETLRELIEKLNAEENPYIHDSLSSVKGLSYRDACECHYHNPKRELVADLDDYPSPDFSLIADWKNKKVIPIATSRGCPFACKFCSVVPVFGREMRYKSTTRVMQEIMDGLKHSPRHIFFVDDNFTASKERAKKICRSIIQRKLRFEWSAQTRTDIVDDPELIPLMAQAGCINVFIGFESINQETLAAYDKKQTVAKSEQCIKTLKKNDIHIHGMFVINPDIDEEETITATGRYAKDMDLDSLQLMALTPLPGTPFFEEIKRQNRFLHQDWSKYDAHHATFRSQKIHPYFLQVMLLQEMQSFYGWKYSAKWLLRAFFDAYSLRDFTHGLFYAGIGFYGRKTTKEALEKTHREVCLQEIK